MNELIAVIVAAGLAAFSVMKGVLLSLYIGLFLGNICGFTGVSDRWRNLVPFITRITGLSPVSSTSVILSFGDRTAGMAALAAARKRCALSDREIIAANLVAKAPSVVQSFVFSFIPVMLPLYPKNIVIHFLIIYFLAFSAITGIGIVFARLLPGRDDLSLMPEGLESVRIISWFPAIRQAVNDTWQPFINMTCWMTGMSFAVMLLIKTGLLTRLAADLPSINGLDANSAAIVGAGIVSMLGGVAAAGTAFNEGTISPGIIVPLLLSVSLVHNCYDLFVSSLPRTIGIFGKSLGLKIALWSFIITQAVMAVATVFAIKDWL